MTNDPKKNKIHLESNKAAGKKQKQKEMENELCS